MTEKTVKMEFFKDAFYTDPNVPLYSKGIHDVPLSTSTRWLKRGAVLVSESSVSKAVTQPVAPKNTPKVEEDLDEEFDEESEDSVRPKKTKSRR